MVVRKEDRTKGRINLVDNDNFIQCASLKLDKGVTFKPHKHIFKKIEQVFPQESWVVLSGQVRCIFYDIDDKIIAEPILNAGDISFSLGGGHNYFIEEDAEVLEMKVGPYLGIEQDKIFI